MACCLISAKALSKPKITFHLSHPKERILMKILSKLANFHWRNRTKIIIYKFAAILSRGTCRWVNTSVVLGLWLIAALMQRGFYITKQGFSLKRSCCFIVNKNVIRCWNQTLYHYINVILSAMVSQITRVSIVCPTVFFFRRRSKKTSKLRVAGLCKGKPPVTVCFPSQRPSNTENISIWWRHHVIHKTR